MYISACQVSSYKGFCGSAPIPFVPGFNVVVGRNSAGKTALMELLSLSFANKPYKSLSSNGPADSTVAITIKLDSDEGFSYLKKMTAFSVPHRVGKYSNASFDQIKSFVEDGLEVIVSFSGGKLKEIRLSGIPTGPNPRSVVRVTPNNTLENFQLPSHGEIENVSSPVFRDWMERRYIFRAERLNVHQGAIGTNTVLAPDARNLPEVLNVLQGANRPRFKRFVDAVRIVFPDIQDVAINLTGNLQAEIMIWFVPQETERSDLAIPLSDCGTGIGQVLAMLYVVINSEVPRTILIDEPQSFLHPGAIRKLFEIFRWTANQRHQFIVTTHSPTVVSACGPCNVVLLYRKEYETVAESVGASETEKLRLFLNEIGARLSDVFGADRILWVEGMTEEICFKEIIENLLKMGLQGTEILAVTSPGDLTGRHKEIVWDVYQKLCNGRGLLPPALGFCFDQEKMSQGEMDEFTKNSKGLIQFIPRRMFENYLLNPKAIAAALNEADTGKTAKITEENVKSWLEANGRSQPYIGQGDIPNWSRKVNAAKLLKDLFSDLTQTRVAYDKIKYGVKLTKIIMEHCPADFDELAIFLKTLLLN